LHLVRDGFATNVLLEARAMIDEGNSDRRHQTKIDWPNKNTNTSNQFHRSNTKIVYTCIPNGEKPLLQPVVPIGEVSLVT